MPEEKKNEKLQQESKNSSAEADQKPKEEQESATELKERLLRLAAEFDNYKKRTAREFDASKSVGKAELLRKILPALDEFELALGAMDLEKEGSNRGIELVYSNLMDALKNEGLTKIEAKGKFDPYKHEIMLVKESNKSEGTIIEVVRNGYTFNGITLRPASVIVAKGEAESQNNKKEMEK